MQYTTLGKTGEKVSWLGMGGMRFDKDIPEKDCVNFIRHANRLGINYFDTAPLYNEDRSESIYGRAFQTMNRKDFKIATKGQNHKTADEILKSIENSLNKLQVEQIDFYFLWCIMTIEQWYDALKKGQALEGILKAKEQGMINHLGVSTHTYNAGIKTLVDSDFFEFIMVPYNALNFNEREEGLRYAHKKRLGTLVMNPVYGGVIPNYQERIKIYPQSKNSPVEDAMRFCLDSPFVDVTLSGMNGVEMISENCEYAQKSRKIDLTRLDQRQKEIVSNFDMMCTSCGYCLRHCPENINIKSYMEIYNAYVLTQNLDHTAKRFRWFRKFGPLKDAENTPDKCTHCLACENECTQYLNITERLEWINKNFEKNNDLLK